MDELVMLFRGLGDESRLALLAELIRGPRYVDELSSALSAPQPKISRHLAYLRRSGLVKAERKGRNVFYHLKQPDGAALRELFDVISKAVVKSACAPEAATKGGGAKGKKSKKRR